MKKSIKTLVKTDFTKLALMAIASSAMLSNPLSAAESREGFFAANDADYRSSARNRRFGANQISENETNQNQNSYADPYQNPNADPYKNPNANQNPNNPYQNQNPNNPYQNQNMNSDMNPYNSDQTQTPGNMNQNPGKYAGGGCKGNGKCRGTSYNYDNQDTNNPANRVVAESDQTDTLNRNNRNMKDTLDQNSERDTINNYNDTDKNNYNNTNEGNRSPRDNYSNCKATSGCKGKSRDEQGYQQDYNNQLRQNRLSL